MTIGPYSRSVAPLDGRTSEAKFLAEVKARLVEHVGGQPSTTQAALIERCAWLTLHVAMLDARALERDGLSERNARTYLAWSNSLARALRELGLQGASVPAGSTLAEYLSRQAALQPVRAPRKRRVAQAAAGSRPTTLALLARPVGFEA